MNTEEIKVKMFKCKCGKARMLSVIDPSGKPFSVATKKEHAQLLNAGCDVITITLEKARKTEICFDCKI